MTDKETLAYLNAFLDKGDTVSFLRAIKDIAVERGGIEELSKRCGLSKQIIYKNLLMGNDIRIVHLNKILYALDYRIMLVHEE